MHPLQQFGNYIRIHNQMIPACNIQVENVPGYLVDTPDGDKHWYGVYFEVMFEDARSWTVEQGSEQTHPDKITLTEYKWLENGKPIEGLTIVLRCWGDFLNLYNEKRLSF